MPRVAKSTVQIQQEEPKKSFADKLGRFFEPITRMSQHKHMSAIKDGFASVIPLTIAAACSLLFISIVFGGRNSTSTSLLGLIAHASGHTTIVYDTLTNANSTWQFDEQFTEISIIGQTIFSWIFQATIGSIALFVSLNMGFAIVASHRGQSPLLGAAAGLGTFLILTGATPAFFGGAGIITAIVSGLGGGSLYHAIFASKKLEIKLPASVPPAVGRAFGSLFPIFLTLVAFAVINLLMDVPFVMLTGAKVLKANQLLSFAQIINIVVLQPFMLFAKSSGDVIILEVYLCLTALLYFCGIHGNQTLKGVWIPLSTLLWIDNLAGGNNVATGPFISVFANFGGTGSTLGGLILMLIFLHKESPSREVAKFAVTPGIFTINEPAIFGLPIIFNPIWFIPYVFSGAIGAIPAILAVKTGWIHSPILGAPWTTPPILKQALLTGFDWRSMILAFLSWGIITSIWAPFVFIRKALDKKEGFVKVRKGETKDEKVRS